MASFRKTSSTQEQNKRVEDTTVHNVEIQVKRSFAHPNGANIRRNAQMSSDVLARVFNECKASGDFTRFYSILGRFGQQWRQIAAQGQDRIGFLKKAQRHEMLRRRAAIITWVREVQKSAFNYKLGAKQTIIAPGVCPEYPIVIESRAASVMGEFDIKLEPEMASNTGAPSFRPTTVTSATPVREAMTSTATQQDPVQLPSTSVQHTPNKLKRGRPSNALLDRLASSIHSEDLAGLMREASEMKPVSSQRCSKYRKIAEDGSRARYHEIPKFILVIKTQDDDESDEDYEPVEE